LDISNQICLRNFKVVGPSRVPYTPVQLEMSETAHIEQVERVGSIIRSINIRACPLCPFVKIKERVPVWQPRGQPSSSYCEIKLRSSQLKVVSPFRLRIEVKRRDCQELVTRSRIRQVKYVLRAPQTIVCKVSISITKHLKT